MRVGSGFGPWLNGRSQPCGDQIRIPPTGAEVSSGPGQVPSGRTSGRESTRRNVWGVVLKGVGFYHEPTQLEVAQFEKHPPVPEAVSSFLRPLLGGCKRNLTGNNEFVGPYYFKTRPYVPGTVPTRIRYEYPPCSSSHYGWVGHF